MFLRSMVPAQSHAAVPRTSSIWHSIFLLAVQFIIVEPALAHSYIPIFTISHCLPLFQLLLRVCQLSCLLTADNSGKIFEAMTPK